MSMVAHSLSLLEPIDLDGLNARAALMVRKDKKYLLNEQQAVALVASLEHSFEVLEINGKRQFDYHSDYFDTPQLHCFRDHNQNRRRRLKVRFRQYADTNLHFLELKLKGRGGQTTKLRKPISGDDFVRGRLSPDALAFLQEQVPQASAESARLAYSKVLRVSYRRSTLVSKAGAVRITMDQGLRFQSEDRIERISENLCVVEVKSDTGWSDADRTLLRMGVRAADLCSKYCVGLALVDAVGRVSRFTPTVKKIRAFS